MKTKHYVWFAVLISCAFAFYRVYAASAPRSKPVLSCELNLSHATTSDPLSIRGELIVENRSVDAVIIAWTIDPLQNMTIHVRNLDNREVETVSYAHRYSIVQELQSLKIESGRTHTFPIRALLLGTDRPIGPGRYRVKISLEYEAKTYISNEVEIVISDK